MGYLRAGAPWSAAWFTVMSVCGCIGASDQGTTDDEVARVRQRITAPTVPIGSTAVPSTNAVFVATTGNDGTGDGTEALPFSSIAHAVSVVNAKPEGPAWTVVVRGGTYREGEITVTRSSVRVQRYAGEHVLLLGSVLQTGFTGTGPYSKQVSGLDTARLEVDCADTFPGNPGAEDFGSRTAFSVSRAGLPLRRVETGTAPATGQYAYDPSSDTLTLGDSPDSIEVASSLYAIRTRASNVAIVGLDVQGYATCAVNWSKTVGADTFYKGSVLFYKDAVADSDSFIRNCTVANNSGGGVAVANARGVRIWDNVIVNHGWDGVQGGNSDGLSVSGNVISFNNVHRWDTTTDAGMKLTRIRDGAVVGNLFEENVGQGFWCDQGCGATDVSRRFVVTRNLFLRNDANGLMYEVSNQAIIASNVAHGNGRAGIFLSGARNVLVWNNTAIDNCTAADPYLANVSVVDDSRCVTGDVLPDGRPCTGTAGTVPVAADVNDRCEPSSRGGNANTCNAQGIVLMNNLISGSGSARPLLNVEDPNPTAYGAALIIQASDYQAYFRSSGNSPSNLIEWQPTAGSAATGYRNLKAFRDVVANLEVHSVELVRGSGNPYFDDLAGGSYEQNRDNPDVWGNGAPLPADVLAAVNYPRVSPAQPFPRIGAISWYGSDAIKPDDGGGVPGDGAPSGGAASAGGAAAAGGASIGGRDGGATDAGGSGGTTSGSGASAGTGSLEDAGDPTDEVDGSTGPDGEASDDGCGCRTAGAGDTGSGASFACAMAVALAFFRRRRRQ